MLRQKKNQHPLKGLSTLIDIDSISKYKSRLLLKCQVNFEVESPFKILPAAMASSQPVSVRHCWELTQPQTVSDCTIQEIKNNVLIMKENKQT